jgi:uncharacterized protein
MARIELPDDAEPREPDFMSVIPPLILGLFIGILSAIVGVGAGFIKRPQTMLWISCPRFFS